MYMNGWRIEARKPRMIPDPKGTKRIVMNGTHVQPVRMFGCEAMEVPGAIAIRPTRQFEDSIRASIENHNGYWQEERDQIPTIRRTAFFSGMITATAGIGLLVAILVLCGVQL